MRRDGLKWREIKAERHKMRKGRLRRGGVDGVWDDLDEADLKEVVWLPESESSLGSAMNRL